jgi:hypothetical protein
MQEQIVARLFIPGHEQTVRFSSAGLWRIYGPVSFTADLGLRSLVCLGGPWPFVHSPPLVVP